MGRRTGDHHRQWNRLPKARDRAWSSMRMLRQFTVPELVATAEIERENVRKYVRGLLRSGYLVEAVPKQNGRKSGHAVYRLVRNTGPRAPRLQRNGETYDVNQHQRYQGGISQ